MLRALQVCPPSPSSLWASWLYRMERELSHLLFWRLTLQSTHTHKKVRHTQIYIQDTPVISVWVWTHRLWIDSRERCVVSGLWLLRQKSDVEIIIITQHHICKYISSVSALNMNQMLTTSLTHFLWFVSALEVWRGQLFFQRSVGLLGLLSSCKLEKKKQQNIMSV